MCGASRMGLCTKRIVQNICSRIALLQDDFHRRSVENPRIFSIIPARGMYPCGVNEVFAQLFSKKRVFFAANGSDGKMNLGVGAVGLILMRWSRCLFLQDDFHRRSVEKPPIFSIILARGMYPCGVNEVFAQLFSKKRVFFAANGMAGRGILVWKNRMEKGRMSPFISRMPFCMRKKPCID